MNMNINSTLESSASAEYFQIKLPGNNCLHHNRKIRHPLDRDIEGRLRTDIRNARVIRVARDNMNMSALNLIFSFLF